MIAERAENFRRKYGIPDAIARQSRYLTFDLIPELAAQQNLKVEVHGVWPGSRRKYHEIRRKLAGKRIAQFPVIVFEKHG